MNEIALQIIEIGKLIGKKVFVRRYDSDTRKYYDDNEVPATFTVDDFENYAYSIYSEVIELIDIVYKTKLGKYYLITFKDLF